MKNVIFSTLLFVAFNAHADVVSAPVTLGDYVLVTSCKEHDCAANSQDVLTNTKNGRVVGRKQVQCVTSLIGQPNAEELKILETLSSLAKDEDKHIICPQ